MATNRLDAQSLIYNLFYYQKVNNKAISKLIDWWGFELFTEIIDEWSCPQVLSTFNDANLTKLIDHVSKLKPWGTDDTKWRLVHLITYIVEYGNLGGGVKEAIRSALVEENTFRGVMIYIYDSQPYWNELGAKVKKLWPCLSDEYKTRVIKNIKGQMNEAYKEGFPDGYEGLYPPKDFNAWCKEYGLIV